MAGLVGVYAGLAAGLFAGVINVFNLAFFRTGDLVHSLGGDPAWNAAFHHHLQTADWNLSFLVVGTLLIAGALALDRAAKAQPQFTLGPMARRFRLIAAMAAIGIALYYPLIVVRAFTNSFSMEGDLVEMVRHTSWWVILLVPTLGGLASGLIVTRMTPKYTGHGVTEVMEAVIRDGGVISPEVPFWKGLAAAAVTGAGGSVGREGPLVQIGAGVGSALGQRLGFSKSNLVVLAASGAAAGIAASFNAPIAGAMFALEIILGDFGVRTFSPIVIASVMGTVTSRALLGASSEVARASYVFVSGLEIVPYALLGLLCGGLSISYIVAMERVEHVFGGHAGGQVGKAIRTLPVWARPALGGLGVGVLGLFLPQVLGTGYSTMNQALAGHVDGFLAAGICLAKIFATSFTLGSGGQGGSFFPATYIGALGGTAFGALIHHIAPGITASSGPYALVGMGAVVAGATQAPLTGIVMLFELTSDYQIILPLMVACILATSLVQLVMGGSLYTLKLREKGIVIRSGRDLSILQAISVGETMSREVETVAQDWSLARLVNLISSSSQPAFPVLDHGGELVGMVSLSEVRSALGNLADLGNLVAAFDLARQDVTSVFPDEDGEAALARMEGRDLECLPVVERYQSRKVVGLVTRREILEAYELRLKQVGLRTV